MINDETEKLITKYHEYLDGFKTLDSTDIVISDPELIKLRHHVLFAYTGIESLLSHLLVKYVSRYSKNDKLPSIALYLFKMNPFFEELDYLSLCRICQKARLITGKQFNKLTAVNNHRRNFAHQNAYQNNIKKYKDRKYYLQVLKELSAALHTIAKVCDKFNKSSSGKTSKSS